MNPSIDDRLISVIRSLTDIILPALPKEASLANEQAQLIIGHLQILQGQLDAAPDFEKTERDDALELASLLVKEDVGGALTVTALKDLKSTIAFALTSEDYRQTRQDLNQKIDALVKSSGTDGANNYKNHVKETILLHQSKRALKDRKWFAAMGFDANL